MAATTSPHPRSERDRARAERDRVRRARAAETQHLTSHVIEIDGRPVAYATGGHGLPVLFIHGWGLDHRAYRRPLKRLIHRGCRVIAPSLPGFGGTAGLPTSDVSLTGHANWVARFLTEIGEADALVVLGHSFGGGVATRLAVDHPSWVSSLVLVNSVGDPTAFHLRLGPRTARPVGFRRLPAALALMWPSDEGTRVRRYSANVVENLLRDPVAVARTAWLAQRADVRRDLETLATRRLGVTVLWSDRDTVIPYSAFDTFCQTFGATGHVAAGGHSWLLTEPDAFAQVLSNVLAVEGERHRSATIGTTIESLRTLLETTTFPKRSLTPLLDGLSPHWLLSAPAHVLAADLALCHPRLRRGEVRVVVRPIDGGGAHRLTVLASDRSGLLADTAQVLTTEGLSVIGASVQTWADRGLAIHSLTVEGDAEWERIGVCLQRGGAIEPVSTEFVGSGPVDVVVTGSGDGRTVVRVTATDAPGLLSAICRWFADQEVSVESASVATVGASVHDVFVVTGDFDHEAMRHDLSPPAAPHRNLTFGDTIRAAFLSHVLVPIDLGALAPDRRVNGSDASATGV